MAAFRELAESCVRQWQANVWGALCDRASDTNPDTDPEYIHQLRVGLRRLRVLLRLFAPVLPETFAAIWRRRLGDNARTLGAARDLDVLCDAVLAPVQAACGADHEARAPECGAGDRAGRARMEALRHLDLAAQGACCWLSWWRCTACRMPMRGGAGRWPRWWRGAWTARGPGSPSAWRRRSRAIRRGCTGCASPASSCVTASIFARRCCAARR
ncbi:MAG: CHAD domain-containing protein [Gammaproteobacteria bacterium]|nr:CHAD domain-containing protein [Gammaproteobacteria bacterium]